uniref:Uncharacterized protein n=1 Tax=Arundo donax TaxID=35708 RepID=A0A0A9GKR6_ARUDO
MRTMKKRWEKVGIRTNMYHQPICTMSECMTTYVHTPPKCYRMKPGRQEGIHKQLLMFPALHAALLHALLQISLISFRLASETAGTARNSSSESRFHLQRSQVQNLMISSGTVTNLARFSLLPAAAGFLRDDAIAGSGSRTGVAGAERWSLATHSCMIFSAASAASRLSLTSRSTSALGRRTRSRSAPSSAASTDDAGDDDPAAAAAIALTVSATSEADRRASIRLSSFSPAP